MPRVFKIQTLNYDKDCKDLYQAVERKKLKQANREKRVAEARFRTPPKRNLNNLSFLEKDTPISLLNKEFERLPTHTF